MNLIYITSKRYPGTTADHYFVKNMANAFTKILGNNFLFLTADSAMAPRRLRSIFYFFWIPLFIFKRKFNNSAAVFFSNDPYLLIILIFWKKLLRLKFRICSDWHQFWNDWKDNFIGKGSDMLISTSENLKNLIIEKTKINSDKVLVAYGGVDLNNFQFSIFNSQKTREKLGFSGSDFLVGYVGFYKTMGMEKGVGIMISALSLVLNEKVKMIFVGGKDEEIEYYKRQAEVLGVQERVTFVPVVPNDQIPTFESMVDVLVIPYPNKPHFREYGFPMKVYEYMAAGRPIIYSNLEIIGEVLEGCAVSFKPDDPQDLALKIITLLNDITMGQRVAAISLNKVADYSWEKRALKIKESLDLDDKK